VDGEASPAAVSQVAPPVPTPAATRFSASAPAGAAPDPDGPGEETEPFVDAALARGDSFTPVPPPAGGGRSRAAEPASPRGRRVPVLVGALVLVLAVGIAAAIALGVRQPSPTSTPAAAATLKVAKIADFDPKADGGSGAENDGDAKLAVDGDPATVWRTEKYRSAALGGLKPGVGLVLDLGSVRTVTGVRLTLEKAGNGVAAKVPAGAADAAPMSTVQSWQTVAEAQDAGTAVDLRPGSTLQTRFLLVYLTSLPKVGSGVYRGGVAEIVVTGR
jgi:putative peptidoglycan lipid II flippase